MVASSLLARSAMDKLRIFEGANEDRSNELHEAAQGSTVDNEERTVTSKGSMKEKERCLLSEADMLKLKEWNSLVPEQVDQCVHTLIVERCRAQEDTSAVCAWDGDLAYSDLNVLSSALAVQLAERGVGTEMFVPLCFEKSRWIAVAVLGVLKAGAAFVLLDPNQPLSRLQELCTSVNAALVLSSSANKGLCEKLAGNVVVASSIMEASSLGKPQAYTPIAAVRPHNAAYASFTSGSTGRPKAVVVEHSAFCSNALAHNVKLHLNEGSRVLQSASYAFGASILQMVMTWIAGGCVCIPSESECRDNLAVAARNFKVNWALFTPSFLRIFQPQDLSSLKHVFLGGEPPARSDITAWADVVQVSGAYGSAECSVLCAIAQNMRSLSDPQSIGQMTGSVGWVVEPDDHHQLVSLGMVGELLVEGPNLARGYLGDAKRTAEVFVEAPIWFSEYCGRYNKTTRRVGRMYKTGDLVRYNPDGTLTFVGRKDTQVKLHGQRVELGEVEHHIRGSLAGNKTPPVVAEVVTPCGSDHPQLVAFIAVGETADGSPNSAQAALKPWVQSLGDWLAERLPRYMVPSAYVAVDTIPLTATGKTDRRRLRELGGMLTPEQLADLLLPSRSALCAPASETEKHLLGLWAHVLNLHPDKIITTDNFLRIGGDSIMAVQLAGAARDQGLSLTVTQIFDAPRLCDMASIVRAEEYTEETILPFSLLRPGTDLDLARAQAAFQCGVDPNLVEDIFPCTPLQEGMIAMTAKRPGDYISQTVLQFPSDGEAASLERAWREAAATVPILRTRIVDLEGQGLVQVLVAGPGTFTAVQDLEAYLQNDKQEPMSLGTPLARFGIIESPRPVVVWTAHHAILDGWSMPLVLKQVEQAYYGHARDTLVPFQGFVRHIVRNTQGANEYWQNQLGGSEAVPFPSLPSPGYQPQADDVVQCRISGLQWPQNDITPSTAVRTAWAILLGQYTSTADVIFGATVTGRQMPVPGVERMAGPTIATIPVRVRLQWGADIQDLLQQIQAQNTSMTIYEQTGLQHIRQISPDAERGCQFQSLLVVQPSARRDRGKDKDTRFKVEREKGHDATWLNTFNTYAMMIECYLEEDGMQVRVSFDSQVIERVQMQRIAWQLEHVLREVCHHRDGPLPIWDICGPGHEDRKQLEKWNGEVPKRVSRCVHDLIAERCRAEPDAPAVCAWDGDFTYGELDRLSSALAAHLDGLGVGPEVFVPLCFEKSRWTAVAMLGVMKAGGAFVLLDPLHPRTRLQGICQTVSASIVVTSATQALTAEAWAARVVIVGTDEIPWRSTSDTWNSSVSPNTALYAVFTSGSTGMPKGTVITHSSYCTSAISHSRAFGLSVDSRVFQFSSYAFDASIVEQLTTLLVGGCICVPSDADRQNQIGAAARRLRITWAELTPSTARMLCPTEVVTLETLVLIGEAVTSSDIERLAGQVDLRNGYGPAECSAISTVRVRMKQASDARNIGKPTGGVCWVIDPRDHERLLPIGAAGELLIEGPIVGRGYLNDPERTAAAFIDPPAWLREFRAAYHGNPGGDRVYKTGDLIQYAADGSLRFVGRKDTQVKLRGQRIELGEVEHHTRDCFPGARDVVAEVVIPTAEGRAPTLIAFVWVDSNTDGNRMDDILLPPTDGFRAAIPRVEAELQNAVPAYMVPAVFLPLAGIPLTATGKTDRRQLRERATALSWAEIESYSVAAGAKHAPTTLAERTLQRLWARVLNRPLDDIGADDSFFRLGGDSISAMQLSSLARAEGFSLTVADIFHSKTVTGLAPLLSMDRQALLDAEEIVDVPFHLAPIQSLFFKLAPNGANYFNQSFLIPLARSVASHELARAIPVIIDRHSMLRARLSQHIDGSWSQSISADLESSYRYHYSIVASLEEAKSSMHTRQRCLDFRNGPLFCVDFIDIGPGQEQYVFLVAHHLVVDLVSWRVILGDLEDVLRNGRISGPKPLPFQAWSQLQADYACDHLDPAQALPFSLPHAAPDYWGTTDLANTWDNAIHDSFTLSPEVTASLFGKANDTFQTQPVEIFLAALWHAFVHTFPDRPPPTIFSEGHGREPWDTAIDLSQTVGWFTTMWPLCIETDGGDHNIVDVVRRSKDMRRRTPRNGWAYFVSRFLNPNGQKAFQTHGPVEIAFNYLGLYQQFEREGALFRPPIVLEDQPSDVAGDVPRFALINASAGVDRGCLRFSFSYNRHMQHQDGICRWMATCKQSLQEAAAQLANMDRSFTLCDFPLLSLTYDTLDTFMKKVGFKGSPREVEYAYPCSPVQRGILMSQTKDAQLYQTSFIWKVVQRQGSAPVDLNRLQRAWRQVVDHHAILRTLFVESISQSAYVDQVVRTSVPVDMEIIRNVSDDDPVTMIKVHLKAAGRDEHALHRLLLYATPTEIFCALGVNHALIDAQSIRILQRDLRLAYDGVLPSGQAPLYSSYISYLQGLSRSDAERYWKSYTDGVEPCLFPALRDENLGGKERTELVTSWVNLGSGSLLREFCQRHEVTLPNLFHVSWGIVLHIYTGSDSVCFGSLNSGRDVPVSGVDDIVGPFIYMLVSRTRMAPDLQVLSLVKTSQAQYLESLPYQHHSLADVLHLAGMSGKPLFNTSVSVQRVGGDNQEETSIRLETVAGYDPTEYDVSVTVAIAEERMGVYISSWVTSLGEQQAERVAQTFKQVVFEIARRPYDSVQHLSIISEGDMQQLRQWNAVVPAQVERCVHELIAERCRAQPDAPAVCAWDGDFTYGELDRLSSALAAHLTGFGVGPEVFVPLLFEKSRWTAVAIVGVTKAGRAFVLLNPSHPRARLQGICRAVSAGVIVASASQAPIAEQLVARVVNIGTDEIEWRSGSHTCDKSSVTPSNALYAVFTSGSTGAPKGAVVSHAAFSTSALTHGYHLSLAQESRVLQFASHGFDVSISDYLTTLIFGGCVCVSSEEALRNDLVECINTNRVNWAHLTPSVVRSLRPREVPGLQLLALIGEPMSQMDVYTWATQVRLVNSYGPAECSVVSATHGVEHARSEAGIVGRGVGCVCWIVHSQDHGALLPIGAVGELLIEGPIVGSGYLNDPEKTAVAFIDPPAWLREFRAVHPGNPGGDRLYKTGDLVQYAADGSLRFVGRKDTQVKLRGQRIELGEVEHHTRDCFPGARDVVAEVVIPTAEGRAPTLIAFVWVDSNTDGNRMDDILLPPTDGFRAAIPRVEAELQNAVPAYMVPAVFLPLAGIPLTATGKTDRLRLRERAAALKRAEIESYSIVAGAKRAPATAAERTLQQLWAHVLNLPPNSIGADDSFFRLGGDSIAAMQLAAAARDHSFTLSVADVFQYPKLSGMSACLHLIAHDAPGDFTPFSLVGQTGRRDECDLLKPGNFSVQRNIPEECSG